MNPFDVKVLMLKQGLTISGMARKLCEGSSTKETSMQTMIADVIYGRRFYPSIALKLDEHFGIKIERPVQFESARTVVQKAA